MIVHRRRAWECARLLLDNHRDRLRPRTYSMCWAACRGNPELIDSRRARRIEALFAKVMAEKRGRTKHVLSF